MSKMATASFQERKRAIFQLRKGKTMEEVAQNMGRSLYWVWKCHNRYQAEGWTGLQDRSRAPKKHGNQLPTEIREAICETRMELEVEGELGKGLKYIGGRAIRTRLKQNNVKPLPSISSIERVLRDSGLVRHKSKTPEPKIDYPHLRPDAVHQLCQIDIVPHFLQGGQRISCFNAIDVVSRYPAGQAFAQRRSVDAAEFLIYVCQKIGISKYSQVDNESCFNGGTTHQYVLGKVVRLALEIDTELVFSPVYHPESNGFVERFHQDYNRHVWQDTYLEDIDKVNQQAQQFFERYRDRLDHSKLNGLSPRQLHYSPPPQTLADDFKMAAAKLPLREGRIHFMRRVSNEGLVRVLNVNWAVPEFDPCRGVWVTIDFQVADATLSIFDQAPDVKERQCLISYPFPLDEPVLAREDMDEVACRLTSKQSTHSNGQAEKLCQPNPRDTSLSGISDDTIVIPHGFDELNCCLHHSPFHISHFLSMY
jgi:transposase InsO family protein